MTDLEKMAEEFDRIIAERDAKIEEMRDELNTVKGRVQFLVLKTQAMALMVGDLKNLPDGSLRDRVHNLEVVNGMEPADAEIETAFGEADA